MNKILYRLLSVTVTLTLALGSFSNAGASSLFKTTSEDVSGLAATTPDYMIISRDNLMALPTSGTAWNTIKSSADASAIPDLCNQDNKADVNALAAGIVYARTGNVAYKTKVVDLITKAIASQKDGCTNAILAMGRQLGGYVLAADFANYRDPSFTTWLTGILSRNVGGHGRWNVLRFTAYDSASNWGVHALSSTTTADIFLNRTADIAKDWEVFSAYGRPQGWPFNKASSYNEQWSCVSTNSTGKLPIAINSSCVKSGIDLDGAPVEDSSRSAFGSYSTYIHESLQGYAVMAQLFERTGLNGWTVNNSQVCRAAKFGARAGRLNDNGVSYFVAFMANRFCGLTLPTKTPTSGGRMFGFSDWLFGSSSTVPLASVMIATSTPLPITPTIVMQALTATSAAPVNTPVAQPSQTAMAILPAGENTFEVRIANGEDDVEERATGSVYTTSNDLELVFDTNNQVIGLRYLGVNIPKGAIITNAYLQFTVDEVSSDVTSLSIQGEASPNALAFAATSSNVTSRSRTQTAVSWSPVSWLTLKAAGPDQRTPNLALIVQEIINQNSWVPGNPMVMIISGSGKRIAKAYESNPAGAPLLHIEYSLPTGDLIVPTQTASATPTASPTNTLLPFTATVVSPTPTIVPATPTPGNTDTPVPTEIVPATQTETPVVLPTETPLVP